jgi:hypothetical protein
VTKQEVHILFVNLHLTLEEIGLKRLQAQRASHGFDHVQRLTKGFVSLRNLPRAVQPGHLMMGFPQGFVSPAATAFLIDSRSSFSPSSSLPEANQRRPDGLE